MVKVIRVREKEIFLKHIYLILKNWKSNMRSDEFMRIWKNKTRGFFLRNIKKPHKATPRKKLNNFVKMEKFSVMEFKKFVSEVRGVENGK